MSLESDKTDLINTINAQIQTNGAQEITAAVLNPILLQIVEWASAFLGDGDQLTEANLVAEIAAVSGNSGAGITILTGTADPNDTPPGSYDTGDFYERTDGFGSTVGWFQYNGIEWAEIRRKTQEAYQTVRLFSSSDSIEDDDSTLIYTGTGGHTFDQGAAADNPNRKVNLVNIGSGALSTAVNYTNLAGASVSSLATNAAVVLQSDGTTWYQIL